jgi:phosphatidylglycerophosphate synthase
MLVAKQVADFFTFIRVLLSPILVWLGLTRGADSLPIASWIMIVSWTSDSLDGPLARRSKVRYRTWLGDHDLEVDMLVSIGLGIYLILAGFLSVEAVAIYALLWIVVFWRWGFQRSLGMLFQAPIYGYFIYLSLKMAPFAGAWMVGWIIAVLVITWPRFPSEVVPGFINGMNELLQVAKRKDG